MIRVNKFLSMCGVCSRRKADEWVEQGRVSVNGTIIDTLGYMIDENKDKVEVDNKVVMLATEHVYLMLNKPAGYITTSIEQLDRPCVLDLINSKTRVFPVGRLDMDSEGLLLFTNDGEFANYMMHPTKQIEKVYVAKVEGEITQEKMANLREGIAILDYVTSPAKVKLLKQDTLEITIREGKKRQVRRMCMAVGLKVVSLTRVQVGNLKLGELKLGEFRNLSKQEVESI